MSDINGIMQTGQKVRIRSNLDQGEFYGGVYFTSSMQRYCGRELVISNVIVTSYNQAYYNLKETGSESPLIWDFSSEMLEVVGDAPQMQIFEVGEIAKTPEIYVDRVIVNDPAVIIFYRVGVYSDKNGEFIGWGKDQKMVSKCNKSIGDKFDAGKGVDLSIYKALQKEIGRKIKQF